MHCGHGSCHLPALLESLGQQGPAGTATHVPWGTSHHRKAPRVTATGTQHPSTYSY